MCPSERRERLVEWWQEDVSVMGAYEIVEMSGLYPVRHPTDYGAQMARCRRDLAVLAEHGIVRRLEGRRPARWGIVW